jgi:hypothetical protein
MSNSSIDPFESLGQTSSLVLNSVAASGADVFKLSPCAVADATFFRHVPDANAITADQRSFMTTT